MFYSIQASPNKYTEITRLRACDFPPGRWILSSLLLLYTLGVTHKQYNTTPIIYCNTLKLIHYINAYTTLVILLSLPKLQWSLDKVRSYFPSVSLTTEAQTIWDKWIMLCIYSYSWKKKTLVLSGLNNLFTLILRPLALSWTPLLFTYVPTSQKLKQEQTLSKSQHFRKVHGKAAWEVRTISICMWNLSHICDYHNIIPSLPLVWMPWRSSEMLSWTIAHLYYVLLWHCVMHLPLNTFRAQPCELVT